jgi:mannose-6-phosphate isomerase
MAKEDRPWGSFEVLSDEASHKVKRLVVQAHKRLSYQRHAHRSEHWFIVAGRGLATIEGTPHPVEPGMAIDVPAGSAHRIENTGDEQLVLVEVQHGTSFDEDDIERLDDDYGRVVRR